jgi:hypothetical protein
MGRAVTTLAIALVVGCSGGAASPDGGPPAGADAVSPPVVCTGNCRYVRAGATGQGTSWGDAFGELPASLERGSIYFIAAGSYPAYTFDDPDGAPIRVLRATAADHGDDAGWVPADADGAAVFGPIAFTTSDYELDGRGALTVRATFEGSVASIDADRVTLRGCELDGAFAMSGGQHTAGACTLLEVGGDDVTIANNVMHDAADDGVAMSGSRITFSGNTVHALHGCGTDGGCGPCYNGHSDGLELYAVKDSTFDGNYLHHVSSTATVFFGNWADELGNGPADYCTNVTMTNNVFYSPDTGFAVYFEDVDGLAFANNVVWGVRQGAYGGLAIGQHVRALDMSNNIILSVNYAHLQATHDPSEHRGDHNLFAVELGQWPARAEDVIANDPGFTAIPAGDGGDVPGAAAIDFTPTAASPAKGRGTTGPGIPVVDMFGTARGNPPTIGAIE